MQNSKEQRSWEVILFCAAIFSAMLVFFTLLHPIPIMDEDDVIYTVIVRKAIPIPGAWNPSRMMPEVLISICGNLAALGTAFGFGRFIDCQVVVWGIVFSLFITAYVYSFFYLMRTRFFTEKYQAVCLSIIFLMLHFLIFRTQDSHNSFMFHTYDACCVFYYTVPALLGCTLVMWFMSSPDNAPELNGLHHVRDSFLLLALYFELFSNLFGSVILAAYAGYRLLQSAFQKEKKQFWKKNCIWIMIVLLWLLAAVLEATGGRAAGARTQVSKGTLELSTKITQAFFLFAKTMRNANALFLLMLAAVIVGTVFLIFIQADRTLNKRYLRVLKETLLWGVATTLAILLLCSATEPLYAARPEAVFPIVFLVFLLILLAINFILQRVRGAVLLLPIVMIFIYSMTNTRFLTFCDSNPLLLDGHVAVAIENEIYESIIEAAKAGKTEITVDVIHSNEEANWPHDGLIGDPMAEFFLKYGIIDHSIRVHINPSDEINEKYHIKFPCES